jgi:diguanylate cyclase (GGDEF)-like protein
MSVVLLEVDNFQKIFLTHGKVVAQQIIIAVSKRLSESMRAEDVAARTGVARFALLLSMTNLAETQTVVARIRETINKLMFDTGKEKIRVTMAAGITVNDFNSQGDFAGLAGQAETALIDALRSQSEKTVTYAVKTEVPVPVVTQVTDQDIQQALVHILQGNFIQIPEAHLQTVVECLLPFMHYVETRHDEPRTAESGGNQK